MKLIPKPTRIKAVGNKPKIIEEFIGNVNSKTSALSIARMKSRRDGRSRASNRNSMSIRWFLRAV